MRARLLFCLLLSLLLLPAHGRAATYYVDNNATRCPACSDSNTCAQAQTISTGRATINKGIECLSAGDTLYIRGAIYPEYIHDTTTNCSTCKPIPSGTGVGTETIIASYPGETAELRPAQVSAAVSIIRFNTNKVHIKFDALKLNSINCGTETVLCYAMLLYSGNNIWLQNSEILNSKHTAWTTYKTTGQPFPTQNKVINNYFHDIGLLDPAGATQGHAIYVSSDGNLVERNRIANISGYCIHLYTQTVTGLTTNNNIIRQNSCTNNARFGSADDSALIVGGDNNQVYNNIFYNIKNRGINVLYGTPSGNYIANNTFCGISGSPKYGIYVDSTAASTTLVNNLIGSGFAQGIVNNSTTTTQTTNLVSAAPGFVASCNDLHLLATSPAVNAGTSQAGTFTTDYEGTTRTGTWDIGALSYEPTVTPLHLVFSQPPTGGVEDVALTPAVLVQILDTASTLQDLDSGDCMLTKASGPGTLGGTLTVTPTDGTCTFSNVTLSDPGTYTLTASRPGTTEVTSSPFVMTAPGSAATTVQFRFQ